MTFKSFDDFMAAFTDPYFINVILVDEHGFLDKTKSVSPTSTMGMTKQIIDGGEIKIDIPEARMKEWKAWEGTGNAGSE